MLENVIFFGKKNNKNLDVGFIVVIVIFIVIVIIFIIVVCFMCLCKKKRKEKKKENGNENSLFFNKILEGEILGMFEIFYSLKCIIELYIFKYVICYKKIICKEFN